MLLFTGESAADKENYLDLVYLSNRIHVVKAVKAAPNLILISFIVFIGVLFVFTHL